MTAKFEGRTARQWAEAYLNALKMHQEDLRTVYEKQQRDRENQQIVFAVMSERGEVGDSTTDYESAALVADTIGGNVVTRTVTPWQKLSTANETIEGN